MAPKRTTTFLLIGGLLVAVGLLTLPAASLAQHEGHHPEGDTAAAGESATRPAKCEMCKMMMQRMETMAKLKAVLNEAKGAAEAEKATKAVEKIDEALALIDQQHEGMHAMMAQHMQKMHKGMMMGKGMMGKGKMGNGMMAEEMKCPMCGKMMAQADDGKVVNARCPIMGNKLDRDNVPESLTREWNGKKVGFCCAACPPKWDKLSDEEKQKKLDAAMDKSEAGGPSGDHEAHH